MQNISLITPPSYYHLPNCFKLLVIAAPEVKDTVVETLRELWPDDGLLLYFADNAEPDTAQWLAYHIPFVDFALLHITPTLPKELLVVAGNPDVACNVEPGSDTDPLQGMLLHHAGDFTTHGIAAAIGALVRSKYLQ